MSALSPCLTNNIICNYFKWIYIYIYFLFTINSFYIWNKYWLKPYIFHNSQLFNAKYFKDKLNEQAAKIKFNGKYIIVPKYDK